MYNDMDRLRVLLSAGGTQANLNWRDNSSEESGYEIWWLRPADADWSKIADLSADAVTYGSTGLTIGNLYLYQVCAINAGGGRACGNMAGINGPTNVSATLAGGDVNLSWTDNSANEGGFNVWRKALTDTGWLLIGRTGLNATAYQDKALDAGTYQYNVCTIRSHICRSSATVSVP